MTNPDQSTNATRAYCRLYIVCVSVGGDLALKFIWNTELKKKKKGKGKTVQSTQLNKSDTMKVLTEGHKYQLSGFENAENTQEIQFIEKTPIEGTTELKTVNDGTTNEELLEVLIDRMNYLQVKFPCRENAIVITKLQESLMWLEKRTADRKKRNVEGKQLA